MQEIMISIHPEWCEKIAPRLKTVEMRKNEPQCKLPFKCYIYETKGGAKKYYDVFHENTVGKVIGEFVCDRIDAYVSELAEQSDGQIRFDHYTDAKGIHDVGTMICVKKFLQAMVTRLFLFRQMTRVIVIIHFGIRFNQILMKSEKSKRQLGSTMMTIPKKWFF